MRSRQTYLLIFFIVLILALLAGLFLTNRQVARQDEAGHDFKVYWLGARYFVLQAVNPYQPELAAQIRWEVFGIPVSAHGYPHRLEYPFHILLFYVLLILLFYLPFGVIPDIGLILAIWMLLLEVAAAASFHLTLKNLAWKPARLLFFILFVFSILWFFGLDALFEGNASILLFLLWAGILETLRKEADEATGFLLALATFKWEAAGPLFLLTLVWLLSHRRWNVLAAFAVSLAALLGLVTVLLPGWAGPFYLSVLSNLYAGKGFSPAGVFQDWWPGLGSKLGWGLAGLAASMLFFEWRAVRGQEYRRFIWAAALSLSATPLLGLPIEPANLVFLVLPFFLIIKTMSERWRRLSAWLAPLLLLSLLVVPWVVVRLSDSLADFLHTLAIFLPLALVLALYWLKWWIIHPPRIWGDQVISRLRE